MAKVIACLKITLFITALVVNPLITLTVFGVVHMFKWIVRKHHSFRHNVWI